MALFLLFISLKVETRVKLRKKKGKKQRRFKPFLLMNEEFCIQYKNINNIFPIAREGSISKISDVMYFPLTSQLINSEIIHLYKHQGEYKQNKL